MFDPKNEQGVVAVFMMDARSAGWEIVEIGSAFPDAVLRHGENSWRVEFEYKAGNFEKHKHDVRDCDIIVCWDNDYPCCPIPVIALNSPGWETMVPVKADPKDVEVAFWRNRCEKLESEVERLKSRIETVVTPEEREIIEISREESIHRRRDLLRYCIVNPSLSYQRAADDLGVTSKTTVYNDLKWLERYGYVIVDRQSRITCVAPTDRAMSFLNDRVEDEEHIEVI